MVKNSSTNIGHVRDTGVIPGLGRAPGGGHGNLLQYSSLENPMDRGPGGLQSGWSQRIRILSSNNFKRINCQYTQL